MRVTQSMLTRNALLRVNQNRANMNDIQEHISSGKKVARPSDDPTLFSRAQRFENTIQQNEQYLSKVQYAESWISNSVSLLEQLNELAMEAKDAASKGADGSSNTEIRSTLAGRMEAVLNEALSLANSQYLGKSVFAGTDTKVVSPFTNTAGVITYTGNNEYLTRSYSESIDVNINVTGQEIMNTGIFSAMTDLVNGLRNDDEALIRSQIDTLNSASEGILALTTDMGARSTNMQLIKSRLEQANVDINGFLSETRDARIDEEIVKYSAEELAYQASLQVTSRSIQLSIMDYFA